MIGMGVRVSGKGQAVCLGFLFCAWLHLAGLSAAQGPDDGKPPPARSASEWFRQGIAAYREARYEEAIARLEACLQTPTEWQEYPHFYLLQAHWKAENVAEALRLCQAFQRRFPESHLAVSVAYIEAEAYRKSADYRLASQAYEACLKKKDFAEARLRYGEVLERLERFSDAYANYQRIRGRWPASPEGIAAKSRARKIVEEHPRTIESIPRAAYLQEEAYLCLRERAYEDALSLYTELQGFPLSPEVRRRVLLNQILAHAGGRDLDAAHGVLRLLMQEYPDSKEAPEGLLEVGRRYWNVNRNQEAFPVLAHLLEQYTDNEEAMRAAYILGRIHFEAGDLKKAARQYRETRFLYPDTRWEEEAAWAEAWCYYLLGRYDACAALLQECISQGIWDVSIPRALYWRARCLEKAGRVAEGREIYEKTRNGYPDSYYAVLAQWRLSGGPLKEVISPPQGGVPGQESEPDGAKAFQKLADPALPLLVETGLLQDAVARLDWLRNNARGGDLTGRDWVEAYCVAGDYLKGLRLAQREGLLSSLFRHGVSGRDPAARRTLHLLYPLPTRYDIPEKARRRGLDPFLVAGLIHQESVFMPDAVSPAGAIGLMQIMPATGRSTAEEIGLRDFRVERLTEPEVNLEIGTAYLQGLASRYNEDWPRVLAAYNAGPRAVARWTELMPSAETDEFVEGILYQETRIYVRKVLYNWSLYHRIRGSASTGGASSEEPSLSTHEGAG